MTVAVLAQILGLAAVTVGVFVAFGVAVALIVGGLCATALGTVAERAAAARQAS